MCWHGADSFRKTKPCRQRTSSKVSQSQSWKPIHSIMSKCLGWLGTTLTLYRSLLSSDCTSMGEQRCLLSAPPSLPKRTADFVFDGPHGFSAASFASIIQDYLAIVRHERVTGDDDHRRRAGRTWQEIFGVTTQFGPLVSPRMRMRPPTSTTESGRRNSLCCPNFRPDEGSLSRAMR
jgi:hypothetical protein